MIATFISDTHGLHHQLTDKLPGGAMLFHSGDCLNRGTEVELINFLEWFKSLPYGHKVFIAGNHDWALSSVYAREIVKTEYPEIHYLQDSEVNIEGYKIYGSPWTPKFFNWAFMKTRGYDLELAWSAIPTDIDILLTHGPALGIGDRTNRNDVTGCLSLLKRLEDVQPLVHSFGHIHEGYGKYICEEYKETVFLNSSVVNSRYEVVNEPMVVDLEQLRLRRTQLDEYFYWAK